ncbi:MAG: HD domain-containing protein [Pseudomonadota bacterium]|nr:HD domain-containing protein [Pseudomonadota bacterium]
MTQELDQKMQEALESSLAFVKEAAQLKQVLRKTSPIGLERKENSAEHSWHLAVMAMVLSDHANEDIDLNKVVRMLLVHDLPEVYADDVFIYDRTEEHTVKEREAAQKLFGLLPDHIAAQFHEVWEEFEAGETAEAKFARALDRFQPCFCNYNNGGGTWVEFGISQDAVFERNAPIEKGSTRLWHKIKALVADATTKGFFPAKEDVKYG